MGGTAALQALEGAGVEHHVHAYELDEHGAPDRSYGEAVAAALGVAPDRLFKTLVARADDSPCVAIVPVSGKLSLKKLATARGAKRAVMADAGDAERFTGYVAGGISPFGQRRRLPAVLDASAFGHGTIFVSAGRRGLQVEVAPAALTDLTGADVADLAG